MINFFISGGALMFLFFAIYSFFNQQGNRLTNRLFGLAFLSRFILITVFFLSNNGDVEDLYWVYPVNNAMQLLSPAFFYLYITHFTKDLTKLTINQVFHFIPGVLLVCDAFFWFSADKQTVLLAMKTSVLDNAAFITSPFSIVPEAWQHPIRRGVALLYLLLIWYTVIKGYRNQPWNIQKKWIYFISTTTTINQILILIQYAVLLINKGDGALSSASEALFLLPLQIVIMMIIFGVSFSEPRLLYGHILISDNWKNSALAMGVQKEIQTKAQLKLEDTPKKSLVDEEQVAIYVEALTGLMEKKKPYLDPNYQISNLSGDLDIPVHHCSYVLNYHIGKPFRDWINGYRIRYFIKQLPRLNNTKTIEAIAIDSGFKNNTTFYNAFKKEKGQLPKEYIKERM
jgi:AraC-like DNA-binding protein